MKTSFTINGKKYKPVPFTFNTICAMEECGVSLEAMAERPMSGLRAYFAICYDGSAEDAGKEIEAHIISGENLGEITLVMTEQMEKSDFFRALRKSTETEITKNQK